MLKHFTATAYIVSKINNEYKVLLHKHNKLNIWIGIGGHVEKKENPVQTLLREVKEETNLKVELVNEKKLLETEDVRELTSPATIIEEDIPAYKNDPPHHHIDLIYFAFCKNPRNLKMNEEHGWFSFNELGELEFEKEVEVFAKLAIDRVRYIMVF